MLRTIQRMPCHDVINGTIGLAIMGGKFHLLGKSTGAAEWTRVPMDDAKCSGKDTTVFLNRELLAKALGFGLTRIELIDARSPQRFGNGGRQMIVMPVRANASPAAAKPAPSSAPASAAAPTNPPPPPAEQPKEETTMPENNGNTTGAPGRKGATETRAAEKPALETAIAQIGVVRGDFRNAIAGLNKLGELLVELPRRTEALHGLLDTHVGPHSKS